MQQFFLVSLNTQSIIDTLSAYSQITQVAVGGEWVVWIWVGVNNNDMIALSTLLNSGDILCSALLPG